MVTRTEMAGSAWSAWPASAQRGVSTKRPAWHL